MRALAVVAALAFVTACSNNPPVTSAVADPGPAVEAERKVWSPPTFETGSEVAYVSSVPEFVNYYMERAYKAGKGEFETTSEHAARTADLDAVLAPLSTKAVYVVTPDYAGTRYDADAQMFMPDTPPRCNAAFFDGEMNCLMAFREGPLGGERGSDYYFLLDREDARTLTKALGGYKLPDAECRVPLDVARSMPSKPYIAYGIRLVEADMHHETGRPDYRDRRKWVNLTGIRVKLSHVLCLEQSTNRVISERVL